MSLLQRDFPLPYYTVIFTSVLSDDLSGYDEMVELVRVEAEKIHGFLGMESAVGEMEITLSYWQNLDAIQQWRQNLLHLEAKHLGTTKWYEEHLVRISKVEEEY